MADTTPRKKPFTVNVDAATRSRIQEMRAAFTDGTLEPSEGSIAREALRIGLDALATRKGNKPRAA